MGTLSNIIFSTYRRRHESEGIPLSEVRLDAKIYEAACPKIKTHFNRESMSTPKLYGALADVSLLRTIPGAIGDISGTPLEYSGASLIGFTSLFNCVASPGKIRDWYTKMNVLNKIGDIFGANVAKAQIVRESFVAFGSAALSVVRVFDTIKELFDLLKNPLVISSTVLAVKTAALVSSAILYVLVYAIYIGLQVLVLYDLSKGDELREKLINSENPVEELKRHTNKEMFKKTFTEEECIEMVLEEGAGWLKKLEEEVEMFPWDPTDESRRAYVKVLFENNHVFMMAKMGKPKEYDTLTTPEQKNAFMMVSFGQFIGEMRLAAKIENELTGQLGPDAMQAFNTEAPDKNAFVAALKSASWSEWGIRRKAVAKIALAVTCAAAIIGGTFCSGGLALGIPLLILGFTGLLWIALVDGTEFMSQWKSGEISKWDKFLVGFSIVLNAIALGTLLTFTVLSGGAPIYIAGIAFAATWLIINAYALYLIIDNKKNPWKYQTEVTVKAFKKFLKTEPSVEELEMVYNKMSLDDQAQIPKGDCDALKKAAKSWKKHLKDLRVEGLAILKDCLQPLRRKNIAIRKFSH